MSPSKRWEYCNVPSCGKDGEPEGPWCYTMSPHGGSTAMSRHVVRGTRGVYTAMSRHVARMGNQRGHGVILCRPPNSGSTAMSRHVVRGTRGVYTAMSRHVVRVGNQRGRGVILCLPPNGGSTAMSRHVVRGTRGAVCYTMSPSKRWEYCNVLSCGKDGEPEGPWCYTMSPSTRWEYCNVPSCGKDGEPEGSYVILCLPPNGGSTAMSRHVVRGTRGVVCYTMSPSKRWEYCDVPSCGKDGEPEGPYVILCHPPNGGRFAMSRLVVRGTRGAVCYTMSPSKRWEYCNVPSCGEEGEPEGPYVILCLPPNGGSTAMSRHVVRMGNQRGYGVILCLPPNDGRTAMSRHVVRIN